MSKGIRKVRWRNSVYATVFSAVGLLSNQALAFKSLSHVATANRTLDQLSTFITDSPGEPNTLVFQVKGKTLNVPVTAKEAYLAVLHNPDFFRAGVIGADGFSDLISGQFWQHSNQNATAKGLVKDATDGKVVPENHDTWDHTEARIGASEFRAIDYPMSMLAFANGGAYSFASGEREQVLAFIMGYLSHAVGDSFAHTWANIYAGGAWDLTLGTGVLGPWTEELKHVAAEGLLDARVPGYLQNSDGSVGGEFDRMLIQAPIKFLDAFFSREIPNHIPYGDKGSSDYMQFLNYYRHLDRFYGAATYNYFNMQIEAAQAIKNFSQMGAFMDFADKWQPGPFVNTLLDIVDFPEQVASQIEGWVGEDFIPFVTGGFLKCELTMGGPTGLEAIRKVWDYLGGFNDRIAKYEEKARLVRLNWMRLSECTAQNMVRMTGSPYDANHPDLNRDACTVIAELPWADEGPVDGVYGLDRGSIRPGSEDDEEFLADLKSYFKGSDDDGDGLLTPQEFMEPKNGHRHIGANLGRMKSYLFGFGFVLDDLEDVIITDEHESNFDKTCELVRDPAEHRCLNYQLAGIALPVRTGMCLADEAKCVGGKVASCMSGICMTAMCAALPSELCLEAPFDLGEICVPAFGGLCEDICHLTKEVCYATVDATCSPFKICDPTGIFGCWDDLKDLCVDGLRAPCDFIAGGDPRCAKDLFNCVDEGIDCTENVLIETIAGEGWADQILAPFGKVCDAYDEARKFFEQFDTLEERQAFAEAHGVPIKKINEIGDIYDRVAEKFSGYPAEYFVNAMFLAEDLQQDPAYLNDYVTALEKFERDNTALPDGDEKKLREGAATKLRSWVDALQSSGVGIPFRSLDPNPTLDQIKKDLLELEKIVESLVIPPVAGPTAKRILADVGPDMPVTFNQFFNTVQGMKLVPLTKQSDVERLFVNEHLETSMGRLPWGSEANAWTEVGDPKSDGAFSASCKSPATTNLYCDVVVSFDDPNCYGPKGAGCARVESGVTIDDGAAKADRFNWVPGRGVVAWNKYNPKDPTKSNVLTAFPLAITQEVYDSLYLRVFDVPGRLPAFMGFEDPTKPWTTTGPGTLTTDKSTASEGLSSQGVNGCGYTPITSPVFNTTELGVVGTKIAFDVMLPTQQSNPNWYGAVQLHVNIPAANLNNAYVGQVELTGRPLGVWQTVELTLPNEIRQALLGDYPNAQFILSTNLSECSARFRIDNLRFTGEVTYRQQFHVPTGSLTNIAPGTLFGFENRSDWTAVQNANLAAETSNKVQGAAALSVVNASGYGAFRSRAFTNTEAGPVKRNLAMSVYIPRPQPNPYWTGEVQVSLTCPSRGLNDAWVGGVPLTHLFESEYNRLVFKLPDNVFNALNGRTYSDCRASIALNVANGAGTFVFDNMGFID
ncbi:MAG TPA: hypothetical protein VIV60_21065 [Polyangiaceae bacterium]